MASEKITPALFHAYLKCPTKCFLRSQGEAGVGNTYADWVRDQNESYRSDGVKRLMAVAAPDECVIGPPGTEDLKTAQRRLAVDVVLRTQSLEAHLHAIERVPSEGRGKPAQFIPIRFIFANKLSRDDRLLLAFDALVLSEVLGREVGLGKIIHGDDHATLKVKTSGLIGEVRKRLDKIAALLSASAPPDLVLIRHCAECQFQAACRQKAIEKDDLSLLERMTPKVMRKYRKRGIFSVNQLSYVYRPRRHKRSAHAPIAFNIELQALAVRTGKIYLHVPPSIPQNSVRLFLDIEGLPDRDTDYLIGLEVCDGDQVTKHSFWANSPDEERKIFSDCIAVAARYPDAPIFHYGSYEPHAFARIAKQYAMKCDWFTKRLVNVNASIFGKVYFPARSNRLKDLGAFVGSAWGVPDSTGLQSIVWRRRWEESQDDKYKELLLAYNRDDCNALRLLTTELQRFVQGAKARQDVEFANAPKHNSTSTGEGIHYIFENILKAAHSEYEQKRICIRPSNTDDVSEVEAKPRRRVGHSRRILHSRAGKIIRVPRKRNCPRDTTHKLVPSGKMSTHSYLDLTFTRSGCRKTLVRYVGMMARCATCRTYFSPSVIRRWLGRTYGHGFQAWMVYQHIALRLPYRAISQTTEALFSEPLRISSICGFLKHFAHEYGPTEERLLQRILQSPFVHADETKINVKGMNQYVWVLTDGKHVIFRRTETRESTLIHTMLMGYGGVLISDFYGGYDAVACRQQKCLVHLIRDLNEDLWKNPFNREYELFVGAVRDLLVPIFRDIDEYGLRKRNLHKHCKAVDRFYRTTIARGQSECEIVEKYKKRFTRYRDSMLRFLDEDGLPWNNNTAERAIRHLAIQRKISCSFSESGADEYLRLLGISQSCRFQGKSFLRFLLSGEKNVDEYAEKKRRRHV
jgi:predicted RecB family nuclease